MKRVSSKTDTFRSLIKCLTLMLGFIFMGVMHADKVSAALAWDKSKFDSSDNVTLNNDFSITMYDNENFSITVYASADTHVEDAHLWWGSDHITHFSNRNKYCAYMRIYFGDDVTEPHFYNQPVRSDCTDFWVAVPISFVTRTDVKIALESWWSGATEIQKTLSFKDWGNPDISNLVITNSSGGSWTNQNVVITVSGATDLFGVTKYEYAYATGDWKSDWDSGSNGTKAIGTWSAERFNYVYFRACDAAGNCSDRSVASTLVAIDKTAPSLDSTSPTNSSGGNWTNQRVNVTLPRATDSASGYKNTQYSYDNSSWSNVSTQQTSDTLASAYWEAERDVTVYFRACDNVGNCASYTSTKVRIDLTKPDVNSVSIKNSSNGNWTNNSVTLTFSGATDSKSGVATYHFSGATASSSTSTTATFTDEMNKSVLLTRVCDNVGNCADVTGVSSPVKIDKTAPVVSITQDIADWSKDKTIIISTSDDASGVSTTTMYYYLTKSSTGHGSSYTSSTSSIPSSALSSCTLSDGMCTLSYSEKTGTYYIFASRIQDVAGNYSVYDYETRFNVTKQDTTVYIPGVDDGSGGIFIPDTGNGGIIVGPTLPGTTTPVIGGNTCATNPLLCGGSVITPNPGIITPVQPGYGGGSILGGLSYVEDEEDDGHVNIAAGTTTEYKYTKYFIRSVQILMDNMAPDIDDVALTNSSGGNWTKEAVIVGFTGAVDSHSGLGIYHFTGAEFTTATNSVTFDKEMNTILTVVKVCDRLENCAMLTDVVISTPVKIDRTAPTVTSEDVYNSSNSNWTNASSVSVTMPFATDSMSGLKVHQYRVNGGSWTSSVQQTESATARISFDAEQESLVETRVCDNVDNCKDYKVTYVKIDRTAPNNPSVDNPKNNIWTNQDVTVTISGGVDKGTYKSGFKNYIHNNAVITTNTYSNEQNATYKIKACDYAGNCSGEVTTIVKIDKTAPDIPTLTNDKNGVWTNTNVTVGVSGGADDNGTYNSGFYTYGYKSVSESSYVGASNSLIFMEEQDMAYSFISCDIAGNCSGTSSTTIKIDKTAPEQVISLNVSNKTATITFRDTKGIVNSGMTDSNARIGSNFSYYMSVNSDLNVAGINSWINPRIDTNKGSNATINISDGTYYLYIKVANNEVKDIAGNIIGDAVSYYKNSEYTVFRKHVVASDTKTSSSINEETINNTNATISAAYDIQVYAEDRMITVTFNSEDKLDFSLASINKALEHSNYKILALGDESVKDFERSFVYHNALVVQKDVNNKSAQNELFDLIVIVNGPETLALGNRGNNGVSTFVKGEELGNVGVSFVNEENLDVETQITLDGVLVKKVDSNKTGTYAIKVVAKDKEGRVNQVERLIIIEENEEISEVINNQETIVAPVQTIEVNNEVVKEVNTNRKVIEVRNIEMRVEKKEEVKTNKKKSKKEERKNKEENKIESKVVVNVLNNNYTYRNKV